MNNDIVNRSDVLRELAPFRGYIPDKYLDKLIEIMSGLPPAEQPMSAVDFIDVMGAMQNHVRYCKDCPLYRARKGCYICDCFTNIELSPDKLVSNVQKWAQEHPRRSEE